MAPRIGYLLPTRARVRGGRPQTAPLLDLATRAESLGFDSVWVGDSLLARPRHDPLTLLAAVAAPYERSCSGPLSFCRRCAIRWCWRISSPRSTRSARDGWFSARVSPVTCPTSGPSSRLRECPSRGGSAA